MAGDLTSGPQPDSGILLRYYNDCLSRYGDTAQGAGWPNQADRLRRFAVISEMIRSFCGDDRIAVCDLGCGTGELLSYFREQGMHALDYSGVDGSVPALSFARRKHPGAHFVELDICSVAGDTQLSALRCDVMVANGLFTVKGSMSHQEMWQFMTAVIEHAWKCTRRALIFNVMSKAVDYERSDLFHVSYDDMAVFLHKLAGRNIGFRADYGLYEYMAYALRTDERRRLSPVTSAAPVVI